MTLKDKEMTVHDILKLVTGEIHLFLRDASGEIHLHVFKKSDVDKSVDFIRKMKNIYDDSPTKFILHDYHPAPKFTQDTKFMSPLRAFLYQTQIIEESLPGILSYLYDHGIRNSSIVKSICIFINSKNKIYDVKII